MHFLLSKIVVSRCSLHVTSLCKEQLSYSRSVFLKLILHENGPLKPLRPWSFSFYFCVECLFDRLVLRGQIESFRIKLETSNIWLQLCLQFGNSMWWKCNSVLIQSMQSSYDRCIWSIYSVGFFASGYSQESQDVFPVGISWVHLSSSPPSW